MALTGISPATVGDSGCWDRTSRHWPPGAAGHKRRTTSVIINQLTGIYLRWDQSQGNRRVYTCVGTNHRVTVGCIPAWGPFTGEPSDIYLRWDQSQGNRRVYTCVGTNHRGTI
eukprot:188198-Pyramimonas_sp.AAC.1